MKIAIATIALTFTFVPSGNKIDPNTLIPSFSTKEVIEFQDNVLSILTDAQTLSDLESVIINMPQNSTITPNSVIALIESHRKTNKEHYTKKEENGKTEIQKVTQANQQILLDAQKAIKKAKYLEDEVERLRKKLEEKSTPRRGLGG
jgi:hypothetical protein